MDQYRYFWIKLGVMPNWCSKLIFHTLTQGKLWALQGCHVRDNLCTNWPVIFFLVKITMRRWHIWDKESSRKHFRTTLFFSKNYIILRNFMSNNPGTSGPTTEHCWKCYTHLIQYASLAYNFGSAYPSNTLASDKSRTAAASTMFRMTNFLMALSLGQHREQLVQRMYRTCPRPFLLRPPDLLFTVIVVAK